MKILYDQRWCGPHGIGRFAWELSTRIAGIEPLASVLKPLHPLDTFWLSWEIARRRPDIFFSPGFNPPISCRAPFVFTIHDLMPIRFAEETTLAKRLYFELIVRPACRRAHTVLTVSEFSRREIIAWSGIGPEKVVNVGAGVSVEFNSEGPVKELGKPYFLAVGNHKPHKNISGVVAAFKQSGLTAESKLVLVGEPGLELRSLIDSLGITDSIVLVQGIPEAELAAYYRGAVGLVFPTLFEGFGLPAVEAMACGTPVITSSVASLPEVVGNSALTVDPLDNGMIANAMSQLYFDNELRCRLSARSVERAKIFNWDKTAQTVSEVLCGAFNKDVKA